MPNRMAFPQMPVLRRLSLSYGEAARPRLEKTLVVAVQHLLESTGSLFEEILHCGVAPENLLVLGKFYSTSELVARELHLAGVEVVSARMPTAAEVFGDSFERDIIGLWDKALQRLCDTPQLDRVIIMDDGGRLLRNAPSVFPRQVEIVGIEQTTSGLWQRASWPEITVIEVAGSAIKRYVEPPLIADAVIEKARSALNGADLRGTCGVVGLGNIGTAVARTLASDGWTVVGYDTRPVPSPIGVARVESLAELLAKSDYIFGCTGRDIFVDNAVVELSEGEKILFSCSSEDIEFQSLIRGRSHPMRPLSDVVVPAEHGRLRIARGGYPINFDGSATSVPSDRIQLTRGLLFAAVLQAILCSRPRPNRTHGEKLSPELQRIVLRTWVNAIPHNGRDYTVGCMEDLRWLHGRSTGEEGNCSFK